MLFETQWKLMITPQAVQPSVFFDNEFTPPVVGSLIELFFLNFTTALAFLPDASPEGEGGLLLKKILT